MVNRYHLVEKRNTNLVLHENKRCHKTSIPKGVAPKEEYRPLIFRDELSARHYLRAHELEEFYMPEEILISEFLCPICGELLEIAWTEGADRSGSGYTERVCHCKNIHCDLDWRTFHTEDGEFVRIERFFFG